MNRLALLLMLSLLGHPALARAEGADALLEQAQRAEASLDFVAATRAYEEALRLRPGDLYARLRSEHLRAHAEGDFAPLQALERMRRSPSRCADPGALASFLDKARRFPAGPVQAEALLLLAQSWARLERPADTLPPALLLARGDAFERPLRARGLALAVEAYQQLRQPALARALVAELPGLAPTVERSLLLEGRLRRLRNAAALPLAALGVAALLGLWKNHTSPGASLRAGLGTSLAVVGVLVAGGAGLARLYAEGMDAAPFAALGAGVLAVERAVVAVRVGLAPGRIGRGLLAALGAVSVLAVAYLALYLSDPGYLGSFGLR